MKLDLKTTAPYIASIAIFFVLAALYFLPVWSGKRISQADIKNYNGMSKEVLDHNDANPDDISLWTGSMFSGMPADQISLPTPSNWIQNIYRIYSKIIPHPISLVFLCFFGFYFLLIVMGMDRWLAIVGAIGFGFSSYFFIIIEAGHNTKALAIAFMPFVLSGIVLVFQRKYLLGTALTALFLSLELSANHPQITYYLLIIILGYGIVKLIENKGDVRHLLKSSGLLLIAVLLGVGPNISGLATTYVYSKETIRGKTELTANTEDETSGLSRSYATAWSYGIEESFSLLVPNFKGGATQALGNANKEAIKKVNPNFQNNIAGSNAYWGNQPFTSGPVYVGAIICLFFVIGLIIIEGPVKYWILITTILSLLLAWGKNLMWFTDFFMNYVPLYNKFRAVSMTLVIAEFTMPLMAVLALDKILKDPKAISKKIKQLYYGGGAVIGLLIIFYLSPSFMNELVSEEEHTTFYGQMEQYPQAVGQIETFMSELQNVRADIVKKDVLRSLFFVCMSFGLVFFYIKDKVQKNVLIGGLAALVLIDMWPVDKRYLNDENFVKAKNVEFPYIPTPLDMEILGREYYGNKEAIAEYEESIKGKKKLKEEAKIEMMFTALKNNSNYRVANFAVSTFNDASTSYFHKSIGGYHGAKLGRYQELIDYHISKQNMEVYNMLNVRYFITRGGENGQAIVQYNRQANGSVWFPQNIIWVNNADEEIAALSKFNSKTDVVIDKRFEEYMAGFTYLDDSSSNIQLDKYRANKMTYSSSAKTEKFVVFSEIYYPKNWKVYIDGEQVADPIRVNYVLRGLRIPAGEHTIEFRYINDLYLVTEKISLASSILILLFILSVFGLEIRNRFQG